MSVITPDDVREFDKEIVSKPATTKTVRRTWVGHAPDMYWVGDLIDFSSIKDYNEGYSYILVFVDLYSRFVYMVALPAKTADYCIDGLKYCIDVYDRRPTFICFDEESGVCGSAMGEFLKKEGIKLYHPHGKFKAVIAERYIRTFKELISERFTRTRKNWINFYEDICNKYNNTPHRHLGGKITPYDVYVEGVYYKEDEDQEEIARRPVLEIGDKVRVKINKNFLPLKKRSLLNNWSYDIFKVSKIDEKHEPTGFKLKRLTNEEPYFSAQYNKEINDANKRLWYRTELRKTNLDPETNKRCAEYRLDNLNDRTQALLNDNDWFTLEEDSD